MIMYHSGLHGIGAHAWELLLKRCPEFNLMLTGADVGGRQAWIVQRLLELRGGHDHLLQRDRHVTWSKDATIPVQQTNDG